MIVVAIIAVLAIVVVPSFMKESKRSKAKSEVHPMVTELSTREEQYKIESNAYLPATACPPTSVAAGTDMTALACATTAGQPWVLLRVQPSHVRDEALGVEAQDAIAHVEHVPPLRPPVARRSSSLITHTTPRLGSPSGGLICLLSP